MPQEPDELVEGPETGEAVTERSRTPSYWKLGLLFLLGIFFVLLIYAWFTRNEIADDFLAGQLESLDLPATYRVESVSPGRQVLANVVVGDPDHPDLTIERVIVRIRARIGLPQIGRITLVNPRLYGSYRGGKLSFGTLDGVLFKDTGEAFSLPDLDMAIVDGRALMETDFGPVGLRAQGQGYLRDGFKGELAAVAPELAFGDCSAGKATVYGKVSVVSEKPDFSGPVRLASVKCADSDFRLASTAMDLDLTASKAVDSVDARISLLNKGLAYDTARINGLSGKVDLTYANKALTARYDLAGSGVTTPQARIAELGLEGRVRTASHFSRIEVEGDVTGERLALGSDLDASLADLSRGSAGTLVGEVVAAIRDALRREQRSSALAGQFIVRRTGEVMALVVPSLNVTGSSGETLLAMSRVQLRAGGSAPASASGNFATGGRGLPRIAGRMERGSNGRLTMRVHMPEYRAGSARLALPQLLIVQSGSGGIGFAGQASVSGALPGGRAQNLQLPLSGNWSRNGGLALWRSCVDLRFDRLELADLDLAGRTVKVCPSSSGAIVRSNAKGTIIAGGVPRLDLAGTLGGTPIRISSGPTGFAMPGVLDARAVEVLLGPAQSASSFRIGRIQAQIGDELAGTFSETDVLLDAVPLDIRGATGTWRYSGGALLLTEGAFSLEDREQVDRFRPMISRGASLTLKDNVIAALVRFREPASDREVVGVDIRHDLASGAGHADLTVAGLLFDDNLQPDEITPLALGVVANTQGTVNGTGRIDWSPTDLTSTGSFTTGDLDFAAAFGPVEGVAGTVRFTDLLGLVTAPDQRLTVRRINPGIEVDDGVVTFQLQPGYHLSVDGARWPFLGGTLTLLPVRMALGSDETLRYTLRIEGLDAARFVERMDLGNISATGTFDGEMPLVFNQDGGFIEGGLLHSRPPGGNVSYVGELTYKDLSTMANFAFDALRSLDYRTMTIGMDGAIDGEMVTRVKFTGVSQGEGATSNFLTKRVTRLPIQFNINLRAPFFQLITSVKSFYDPEYVRDPRTLGLVEQDGTRLRTGTRGQQAIQPAESGDVQ